MTTTQIETLDVEENAEGQTQAGTPQEDVEANTEAEGAEV
jgi:hypothetical protein